MLLLLLYCLVVLVRWLHWPSVSITMASFCSSSYCCLEWSPVHEGGGETARHAAADMVEQRGMPCRMGDETDPKIKV